jgi:predicted peptidase
MLDQVLAEYRADPAQVILTGLSWGGMGTWRWGMDQPERFAALVPICGGVSPSGVGALKGMPVWAFHGDADTVVPLEGHRRIVEAAKSAGANVRLTVYPGIGHNSWDRAYADPLLEEWMLAQRRR